MVITATVRVVLLGVFLIHLTLAETKAPRTGCVLSLNILLAGNESDFVYTCDCDLDTGRLGPIARAALKIPPSILKSRARSAAVIRCIRKAGPHLLPLCRTRPRQYDRQAKKVLKRCISAKPNKRQRRLKGKFRFSTRKCSAILSTFFGSQTAGVWICECVNPRFDVITGRAAFITDGSPLGAAQELETVKVCGTNMMGQMREVCENSPRDFGILGLQLLQVCCKRGRIRLPNGKFGCAAIVPDNLEGLKDTS